MVSKESCFTYTTTSFYFSSLSPSLHPPFGNISLFTEKPQAELGLLLSVLQSWAYIFIF